MSAIFDAFVWTGMKHDGKIEFQSQRADIYQKYIKQLLDEGKAYKCYKTKDELTCDREKARQNKQTFCYDGTWRPQTGKTLPPIPNEVKPAIRIKAPQTGQIVVSDGIKGDISFGANQVDDFVIARDDGEPTYNFVVAIDDAMMGISDVIRGDDHLSNTPKQIVVYEALGFELPKFFHIPMINNSQGKKLSKRDGALDVMDYKTKGILPEALLNFLVRLGWSYGDQELFSIEEMTELFDPKDINSSSSSFNEEKLLWLNSIYIKDSDNKRLVDELKSLGTQLENFTNKEALISLCKQRANTTIQLQQSVKDILHTPTLYEPKGVKKFIKTDTIDMLNSYIDILTQHKNNINSVEYLENITKPFITNNNLKFPQLFQPIRLALTGKTTAPSVYDIVHVLGVDETIHRLKRAITNNFDQQI
jgi:glutamyl-tRNA synthetase